MKKILVDAGPLIALFDKNDSYHSKVLGFMNSFNGILVTTWPVIAETFYMLNFNINVQMDFIEWIERGGLEITDISRDQLCRVKELCIRYLNIPIDLADATLVVLSESAHIREIMTIDSDFNIYRNVRREYLKNVLV
ncbi:MAG: PIN domain-containing protein [Ruminiclostridium sp.]|nr:PIN domain-containing protein [Ruminiclostridium sp.]